ncbi:YlxR family protein [Glaciihabitans sp. UYNi722]|uniref:YlxR family protein n=1 Tax=Glaciihabitans sp. UYNi722 TaxID=3156344 RepID=UPI003393FD13
MLPLGNVTAPRGVEQGDKMEPVRTCLGCRRRADRSSLLRVVARNGEVVADHSATLPGRGGWVHPTLECVENSIKRRAFGRALRVDGVLDAEQLRQSKTPPPVGTSNQVS